MAFLYSPTSLYEDTLEDNTSTMSALFPDFSMSTTAQDNHLIASAYCPPCSYPSIWTWQLILSTLTAVVGAPLALWLSHRTAITTTKVCIHIHPAIHIPKHVTSTITRCSCRDAMVVEANSVSKGFAPEFTGAAAAAGAGAGAEV
jgi:hypothetical protein